MDPLPRLNLLALLTLAALSACRGSDEPPSAEDELLDAYSASAKAREPNAIPLGGINVWAYCNAQGYPTVGYRKGYIEGPEGASDNWVCQTGTDQLAPQDPVAVDMDAACRREYDREDVVARPTDPENAWSWHCYTT